MEKLKKEGEKDKAAPKRGPLFLTLVVPSTSQNDFPLAPWLDDSELHSVGYFKSISESHGTQKCRVSPRDMVLKELVGKGFMSKILKR